jgi:peptidoglycan/xylan/chitin deacetylase (PgdA/CDA1 family)
MKVPKAYNNASVLLLFCCLLLACTSTRAQPKIIIKLDDLGSKNGVSTAAPVLDDLLNRKIKAALGVIANRLDKTAPQAYAKYLNATSNKGEKLFEIWHHGFDHSNNNPPNNNREFDGTSYDFQSDHFNRADQLVLKLLGVQMHTFGSPYNAIDSNTKKMIGKNPNYKVFLLSGGKSETVNGVLYMNNRVNMESATGKVNYDYFVTQYQKLKGKYPDYIVLQGHANQWDAARLAEFNKILDFLIAEKCEFVLPYDYYLSIK